MKIRIKLSHLALFLVILILLFSFLLFTQPQKEKNIIGNETKASTIYIAYSPHCPHCHHLIEELEKNQPKNVRIILTTNGKAVYECLKQKNYSWNFGVPLTFALLKNGSLIIIQGYPSKSQDINGYFLGKENEEKICEQSNGKKFFDESGNYIFCKIDKEILGNRYSINYLIKVCEINECLSFCDVGE